MKIYIPSYQRAQRQKTLRYLADLGYTRDEIFIATQTERDRDEYARLHDREARIIFRPAHSIAENRNTLMELMSPGEQAVMLDDDISRFDVLRPIKAKGHPYGTFKRVDTRETLDSIFEGAFRLCKQHGGLTWGMYSIHNERMMYGALSRARFNLDRLFAGTLIGIIRTAQVFNTEYQTKEDYEYLLRQAREGRPILRLNWVAPYAEHFTSGGCSETRSREGIYSAALLSCEFPEFVRQNKKKPEEINQIKPLFGGKK